MAKHRSPEHIFKEYGLTRAPKQHNPAHTARLGAPQVIRPGDPVPRGRRVFTPPRVVRTGPRLGRTHGPIDRTFGGGSQPGRKLSFANPSGERFEVKKSGRRVGSNLTPGTPRRVGGFTPSVFGRGVSASFGSRRRRPLKRKRR